MPEKIAMTPPDLDGKPIEWLAHNIDGKKVLLPQAGNTGYGSLLTQIVTGYLSPKELGVRLIQNGDEADTYKIDSLGLFLRTSVFETNEPFSTWLSSNLILADVFERAQVDFGALVNITPFNLTIKTPRYFGFISAQHPKDPRSRLDIVLSQDVSVNRRRLCEEEPYCVEIEDELQAVGEYLIDHYYPGVRVHIDSSFPNIFVGQDDVAKIDCDGMFSDGELETTLWKPSLPHCG